MTHPLSKWIPYKLLPDNDQAVCRWLHIGDMPFQEPFFDDTIFKCKSTGIHRYHSVSDLGLLPAWASGMDAVAPTAFIFHISRCGSTLLSQLLGLNPQHIVLSEVPFIDQLLRTPFQQQYPANIMQPHILEAAIRFYGQKRTGAENRLFIKTDSWHVFFYPLLRKVYPEVPFILLYRKPAEVIRSHQKKRGMQAVPGVIEPEVFGFDNEAVTDLDAYMARVIERYLTLFLEIIEKDPHSLLVNYHEGMLHAAEQTAAFSGFDISAEDHIKMEKRCRYHAKYPDQVFAEHNTQTNVPEYLQKSLELYQQLELKRAVTASLQQ